MFDKIPNKFNNDIYSIYTDYKSDFTEDYTTIIGLKVNSLDTIPEGLIGRQFAADNFVQFIAKGQVPKAVLDTWASIWEQDKELNRKYSYDFEVYGDKSQNGENQKWKYTFRQNHKSYDDAVSGKHFATAFKTKL